VEYKENKVRDLLALERPKKKKNKKRKTDYSKVQCFNCKKLGHYVEKCPEPRRQRGTDLVTCERCNQKGHYARRCIEKSTLRL
jgi:hypothetical protein